MAKLKPYIAKAQEYSVPLILGVVVGIVFANISPALHKDIIHYAPFGKDANIFGHQLDVEFLINEVFMVFFFGLAAKEITQSILPGGSLNPVSRAVNPLIGTLGGVFGPVAVYFLLVFMLYGGSDDFSEVANGWAIPTATDIALAWLVARVVFGSTHPAVFFLLLLAVADDATGLVIIAVFYPTPEHPVQPLWLLLAAGGVAVAYLMRRAEVSHWLPYVAVGGAISWVSLLKAGVEPALDLVFIVPFLPVYGLAYRLPAEAPSPVDSTPAMVKEYVVSHSPLIRFERHIKLPVDMGLFFFAFVNAGVRFGSINSVTWIILASLVVGKTVGISLFSLLAHRMGFPLPVGMSMRHLVVTGLIAGLGLTVALFIATKAFSGMDLEGPAKMGAILSMGVAFLAIGLGKLLRLDK